MLMRNYKNKGQKGSLLVEAIAMLGLIAMVTPLLYKKAAERTNELQDINAASQMRTVANAVDAYLRDNYDKIVNNEEITSNCDGGDKKKYNFSQNDSNESIPLEHLCEYLPYGFNDKSMMFADIQVGVKRRNFTSGNSVLRQDLTALILATPNSGANMPRVRASRIASMIGTNGGFVDNKIGYGVQGVWKIELSDFDATDFKPSNALDNAVLATSLESIASGNHGREDVLHRNQVDADGKLNTMNTTLRMGDYPIIDVQQMIVTGDGLSDKDKAILLKEGTGIDIESGNLHVGGTLDVGGNTKLGGTLDVSGDTKLGDTLDVSGEANFHNNVTVDLLLKALQLEVTQWLKAGSAEILGQLSAAGEKFLVEGDTGNTTIKGTLNVQGNTTLDANLEVKGESKLLDKVTIGEDGKTYENEILTVYGDARFKKDIYVEGAANIDNLNVREVFQAGLGDDGNYNFYADKDKVDILVNNFMVGHPTNQDEPTGFLITEELTRMKNGTRIEIESPDIVIGPSTNVDMLAVSKDNGVSVNQAKFIVRTQGSVDEGGNVIGGEPIFQVDPDGTYQTSGHDASVYVRKGVIELGRNDPSDVADKSNYTGYIKLDRIVANQPIDDDAFHEDIDSSWYSGYVKYDEFQVNPAYTSVMHDIKLTTRGGARLSDILPDFINKGIYVLDGTYKEDLGGKSVNWETHENGTPVAPDQFPFDINKIVNGYDVSSSIVADDCDESDPECPATPWLGFIPVPTCPPGYIKVATLSPIRWAMAQAGIPYRSNRPGADADEITLHYNRDPNDVMPVPGEAHPKALTFQQNTWLNTSLKAFSKNGVNYGWSGIIGFNYPGNDYKKYITAIGEMNASEIDNYTIVWNLFEVYNQQIVGIANVYCYFNRRSQAQLNLAGSSASPDFKNDELIDRYDQMTSVRVHYNEKDSDYVKRLNDPKLKYTDPW